MKNSIDALIEFSFQGKDYTYTSSIDLDELLLKYDEMPQLYPILARLHNIDTYSYLYEVMQEAEVEFSNPQGCATDYITNGEFDTVTLANNWQAAKADALLQVIAARELGITDLNEHQALQRALIAAYNLGKKS